MFAIGNAPAAAWNDTFPTEPRFESLRSATASVSDPAKQKEMHGEMQINLRDDGRSLIFAFINYALARNEAIAHRRCRRTTIAMAAEL